MKGYTVLAAAFAVVASGVAVAATGDAVAPNPMAMSIKEIRVHNASLDPGHPQFIVCKRESVTGSLAKKNKTCLTKQDWKARADKAREWTEGAQNRGLRACSSPNGNPCE
jgi:hypothetical protein